MIDRERLAQRLDALATDRAKTCEALAQTQNVFVQQQTHLARVEGAILELQALLAGESEST